MTAEAIERELAFTLIDPSAIERHPLLVGSRVPPQRLVSTYYDTADQRLGKARWSVRRRRLGDGRQVQTIKGPRKSAVTPELEIPLDGTQTGLNIEHLRHSPVWTVIDGRIEDLNPLFETKVNRTVRKLVIGSSELELACDIGDLIGLSNDVRAAINDLELEMKSGDIAALFRVAITLVFDVGLWIEPASKAQRGYHLVNGVQPAAVKHTKLRLENLSTRDCFRAIMTDAISHLEQNIHPAASGDASGIHQMRIGLRRLRAAIMLFASMIRPESVQTYNHELRHFGLVFGRARDWDVFIGETLAAAGSAPWVDLVRHEAADFQRRAHANVAKAIREPRLNSLIVSLMAWSETAAIIPSALAEKPFRKVAPTLLSALADKVVARQQKLDNDDAASCHALRKSIKKLRYGIEFVEALYPHRAVKNLLDPSKQLQMLLGQFNDIRTTHDLSAKLLHRRPAVAYAVEHLLTWTDRRQIDQRALTKALHRLEFNRPFWLH